MSCERYQDALIEPAASGADPQGELRRHLDSCAHCRAAFVEEQSLFSAIDAGLHATANTEVPPSLLPRVRARLDEVAAPRRMWTQPLIFVGASVALAFAIFLYAWPHRARPDNQVKQAPQVPAREATVTNAYHQNSDPGTQIVSSDLNNSQRSGHSTLLRPVASSQPEVLIPPDEREAFSHFVFTVQQRPDVAAALLASGPKNQDTLMVLEPLQIADLELKPLEGRETEILGRVGEPR